MVRNPRVARSALAKQLFAAALLVVVENLVDSDEK